MNFKKLRPIDDNVKRGDALLYWYPDADMGDPKEVTFVAGPDASGYFIYADEHGVFQFAVKEGLWIAPLCWVEERPVYKGDVLYWRSSKGWDTHVVDHRYALLDGGFGLADANGEWVSPESLTWTKPKTKKTGWAVFVKADTLSGLMALPYPYLDEAEARETHPDAVLIQKIEWEE